MSMLDWIDFGRVSAERDDLLSKYFHDNGVLSKVISSASSFLILGRKGAGKTAVFKHLTENSNKYIGPEDILVPLSFEDYNWNIHALLTNDNKAESLIYRQSWRFVMLVECLKAYKAWLDKKGKTIPKRIIIATKLLEKIFDSPIPSISQIVGRKLLSLSKLRLPSGGLDLEEANLDSINITAGEISFEEVNENKSLKQNLSENIENIINHLDRALGDAEGTWPRIFVCFDRVDEAWDEVSFESSKKVIAGLVSASDAINHQYKGKIRPIVFLREDIFDVLSINDSNKLREDCGALLHWNKESLMTMILKRVNYYGKKHEEPTVTELDSMFDRTEMRQRARPSNYIIRRTMMRPRDIISILNRTIEAMREKVNDPFGEDIISFDKIECESIYNAEPGYSEWLKKELLDEWSVQRPIIDNLLKAIQSNCSTNINGETFKIELEKILGKEIANAEVLSYLRFLFDNSIIGFKVGESKEWRYKCFYPSQGFIESEDYRIHEGLVRALNLIEPRGAQAEG